MVREPSTSTLKKYGVDIDWWRHQWFDVQGGVCAVCGREPPLRKDGTPAWTVIDHQHVRGFKKMPPEERRKYVRGIVCITCNHFVLTRYGTVAKFLGAAAYIYRYENPDALDVRAVITEKSGVW
jgi:hypothetical protein